MSAAAAAPRRGAGREWTARRRRCSCRGTDAGEGRRHGGGGGREDYDSSSFFVSLPSHLHLVRFETLRKQSSEIHLSWDGIHQMGR